MRKTHFFTLFFVWAYCNCQNVLAQNVGIGTTSPSASAQLDVNSTTKGFLPPRMTYSQRNLIANPVAGLVIYCTDCDELQIYNGTVWKNMNGNAAAQPTGQQTINICDQIWMVKNLDVSTYRNGDVIPQVTDPTVWSNLTIGAWCYYNNNSTTGNAYGKLYNWYALNDPRGLAPLGWHIPNDAEWASLFDCFGGVTVCGGEMKESGTTHWTSPNTGATNSSGFTALPGGYRRFSGTFQNATSGGGWWSSSENNTAEAPSYNISYLNGAITKAANYKSDGYSIRCVKGYSVGDNYGGGIIFYVFGDGKHGLIAAPSDQGTIQWGCQGTTITGADGIALGTGNQNTLDIVAGCTTAGIAAEICSNLVLNGYNDWYLPSKDELNLLFLNKSIVGGLANNYYWSSTEADATGAWYMNFNPGGGIFSSAKQNALYVRAIRSF